MSTGGVLLKMALGAPVSLRLKLGT